ncbi:MAG: hypothetical protein DMF78_16650 [Acidobacteria bacterium]|nr:MAG: hypothetical protein DMF78_16650 [Acidobacteriota bacterium]
MRRRSPHLSSLVVATTILVVAGASTAKANQPPVATPQNVTTAENTAVAIILSGTDPDGDPLTFAVAGAPASGTLTGSGAYRIYTPSAGFSGSDSFSFTADDGSVTSNPATMSITVTPGPAGQPFAKVYTRSGGEAAHSVARTQDGGYVYAGETTTPGMGKDVWVVKVDGAGKVVWQYAYGGAGDEGTARAYGVAPELNRVRVIATSDGGYAVTATTEGSFGPGGTSQDAWVLKLDALGAVMWQFAYGGYWSEAAADIVEIPGGGGYAVAGSAQSFYGTGYDAWILRLDPNGALMWQTTYGLWGDDYATSLTATPWGGLALTGSTYSFGTDPSLWVMMLDPGLNVMWNRVYAASGFGAGNSIVYTSDGGLAVTGTIGGQPGVLKLDSWGNVIWQSTLGSGSGYEGEGRSIVQTADGGYAVAGVCCLQNEGDVWVLRLDAAGAPLWQKSFGGVGIDRANGILQTPDGGYAVAGETWSFGPAAALLLKLDANGNVPSCVPLATPSSLPPVTVATTDFPVWPSAGAVYGGVFTISASPASTTATTQRQCPNSPPVANAGGNLSVFVGDTVQLDGSASSDADGDPLTYAWSLASRPPGSAAALSSTTTVNPTFVPDVAGTYVVHLAVSDALSTSPSDSVTITAVLPSLQLAPAAASLLTFESTTLTVTSAKAGVQAVNLASSNVAVASVPASTTTPPGVFTVTAGATAGTATITASATSFTPATSQVTVALRSMTLSTAGPLVGINKTLAGTITLAQGAPSGVTISLVSSAPGIATVTAAAPIAQGATSGSFTVTGVAVGNATITASAPGFSPATVSVAVTALQISLGQGLVIAPGQAAGLALSIGQPAPAGGVTINLASANPAVATVTSSAFIPAGQQIPAANPTVTGVSFGSAQITASSAGYAGDTSQVQVTVTLGLNPTSLTVIQGATGDITLGVSAPAPLLGFTFNVVVANAGVATALPSVTVTQGKTSEKITVTGVSVGTTTLQVSAPGVAPVTATIKVDPKPAIYVGDAPVGKDLQMGLTGYLGGPAPANNVPVTVTSADPTRVVLSTSPTAVGTGSITLQVNAGGTGIPYFYVQALDGTGSVQITTSAAGYTTDTSTVSLFPSGFIINSPSSISTNSRASNTSIQLVASRLTPTLAWNGSQPLRAGMAASVPVTGSNASVGTITVSPVVFNANDSAVTTEFDPQGAGTATISIGTPAGFSTPTGYQQITATVTAPAIHVAGTTIGKDLQASLSGYLDAPAPAGNLQVTVTSADAARLLLSTSATTVGSGSITLQVSNPRASSSTARATSRPRPSPRTRPFRSSLHSSIPPRSHGRAASRCARGRRRACPSPARTRPSGRSR